MTTAAYWLRAALASCSAREEASWVALSTACRAPAERVTVEPRPTLVEAPPWAPAPPENQEVPTLKPRLAEPAAVRLSVPPTWSSLTSDPLFSAMSRRFSKACLSFSFRSFTSVERPWSRRSQSTIATRVLSPGARARLCISRPSVTPPATHFCSVVTTTPSPGVEYRPSVSSPRSTGPFKGRVWDPSAVGMSMSTTVSYRQV